MKTNIKSRRIFLSQLATVTGISVVGRPALSAGKQKYTNISDNISLITGAGGNVTIFKGNQGVTLIDSGNTENSEETLSLIDELSGNTPIKTLFNTHWHSDHTGGNEVINARGAEILAHENTRLWMTADFEVEWRQSHHSPRHPSALPHTTFYESGEKDLGGEIVQYHHYPRAHTDGDIVLFFPQSNVMVAGGLLTDGGYPISDIATGGWIGDLIRANAAMLDLANDDTVIIPDSGAPRTKSDLQAQHDMLSDLYEIMKDLARKGMTGQNMLDANITANYDPEWGDPTEFVLETYKGMAFHTYDMGGFI